MVQRSSLLLLILALLLASSLHVAAVECDGTCTCTPHSNYTVDLGPGGTIYLAGGDENSSSVYQNGSYASPFLSLSAALDAVKSLSQDITILLFPGNHYVDSSYSIVGGDYGSVDNFAYGQPRDNMVNKRALTFRSVDGFPDDTLILCSEGSSFLSVFGVDPGETSTLTLTLDSLYFVECGTVLSFAGEKLVVTNSVFEAMGNGLFAYYTYEIEVTDSYFVNNQGDIAFQNVLETTVSGCTFLHTTNPGAANSFQVFLYGDSDETALVTDCTFEGSRLINFEVIGLSQFVFEHSFVYNIQKTSMILVSSHSTVRDVQFVNSTGATSIIQSVNGEVSTIDLCSFRGHTNLDNGILTVGEGSSMTVTNAEFLENDLSLKRSFLFVGEPGATLTIENMTSTNDAGFLGFMGVSYLDMGTQLTITNAVFTGTTFGGLALRVYNVDFTFTNVHFDGVTSVDSLMYAYRSNGDFNNVKISETTISSDSSCGAILIGYDSTVNFNGFVAENNEGFDGTAICSSQAVVSITSSSFTGNHALRKGGAAYFIESLITLVDSNFTGNSAADYPYEVPQGGALYITGESVADISGCRFEGNVAPLGGGVAVYVADYEHNITFTDCEFLSNNATQRGGAVYSISTDFFPIVNDPLNVFSNNMAALSGSNFAGPSKNLVWSTSAEPALMKNASGLYLPEFTVVLKDTYDNKVFLGDSEFLILKVEVSPTSVPGRKRATTGAETVGEIQKAVIDGEVTFSNIRVAGTPGSYEVLVHSAVNAFDPSIFSLNFSVDITQCGPGFILQPISESEFEICVLAICTQGCIYGTCMEDSMCECNPGYEGDSCQFKDEAPYYPNYSQGGPIAIAVITGLLILVLIFFAATIVIYRATPVIKSASPAFCILTLFGMLIAYIGVYTYVGLPTTALCTTNLWFINSAFVISFGSVLAKNWRIYRIFGNRQLRVRAMKNQSLMVWVLGTMAVEAVLLIIWSAYDPPSAVEVSILGGARYITCGSTVNADFSVAMLIIVIIYNALLTGCAAWLAFKTRKLSSAFHDSTGIALSVYNFGLIAIIILPLIYSENSFSAEAVYYIKSITVLLVTTVGMMLLFAPKIYIIYIAKSKNVLPKDALMKHTGSFNKAVASQSLSKASMELTKVESAESLQGLRGKLGMQIGLFKLWRPRYVELHPQVGVLTIFEDETKGRIGHALTLGKLSVMNREDHSVGCFMLQTEAESYLFQAEDQANADLWIQRLNQTRQVFMKDEDKKRLDTSQSSLGTGIGSGTETGINT